MFSRNFCEITLKFCHFYPSFLRICEKTRNSMASKLFTSNHLRIKFFCKKVNFTKYLYHSPEMNVIFIISILCCENTAWKLRKYSLSHFFGKNFVKVTFLLRKLLKSWFHEFSYSVKENFSFFHTVEKQIMTLMTIFTWNWMFKCYMLWILFLTRFTGCLIF